MKIRNTEHREHIVLQMTPMIDIVFQLLVFFVFTFKIVLPEGDFNIRMPASAGSSAQPSETPLLKVKLVAGADRELARIQLGDQPYASFLDLQNAIRGMVDDSGGPGTTDQEVEIDADFDLRYQYAINAMTAITGYQENGVQHKLIERVRFAPLKE
ncbi:ExbD/TolR family protein [Adhaeretor mobilis]|uniref:Biopolymer transport protein ExbD/TolR n=1 Tax=Adhaeretor mobilis TaxID=1930276 RepID=A0A517MYY5_9BACT|nr:biopolymer transporter ExbD [Adhaeretor mobilis]QDT00028.1 Biopolymer transport protein ExbD/TolR [Adhaeretor mobilis]